MSFSRASGIIMHPTSLPGPYGMGDLGPEARRFVDALQEMGQHLWQVLPLGPTSYGDSPYQSLSTFAGNTLLISFDQLVKDGLLSKQALSRFPKLPAGRVNYGRAIPARKKVLATVCRTFNTRASKAKKKAFERFCHREAYWLDEYALFVSLKDAHKGRPWTEWPEPLVQRDPAALKKARTRYRSAIRKEKVLQFLFYDQWKRLTRYAARRDIKIIGDIPIFVAHDSADVWVNQDLFFLDSHGQPIVVAGVPPDYFSATGQLWGNPLYRWNVHRNEDYAWWMARMKKMFQLVDYVRIDHFRGFEKYWEIPAYETTAINGRWVEGPDADLFEAMIRKFGSLPIIAEDLGVITPEVEALRDRFRFPGMRVLQFAFGKDPKADDYRPENFPKNCAVYTGTHDNDTTVGWFWSDADKNSTRSQAEIEEERRTILRYVKTDGDEIHWDLIALASHSQANTVIFPMQDVLGLGSDARMNVPGRESGNWQWRLQPGALTPEIRERLRDIAVVTKRTR